MLLIIFHENYHENYHFSWALSEIDYLGQSKKTCSFSWSRLPGENMWLYCLMSCLTPCIPMLILRCLKIILKSELFLSSGAKQGRSTTLRWRFFATPHFKTSIFTSSPFKNLPLEWETCSMMLSPWTWCSHSTRMVIMDRAVCNDNDYDEYFSNENNNDNDE